LKGKYVKQPHFHVQVCQIEKSKFRKISEKEKEKAISREAIIIKRTVEFHSPSNYEEFFFEK